MSAALPAKTIRNQCKTALAKELGGSTDASFAKGIQIYCVEYSRGTFAQMSATCCIEVLHGLLHANCLYVVVQTLQPFLTKKFILKWKRLRGQKEILPASKLMHIEPMRLLREDQDGLWLLR